jgi:hypothetical protein
MKLAAVVAALGLATAASSAAALSTSVTDVVVDGQMNVYGGDPGGGGAGIPAYQFALPDWTDRVLNMDLVRGEVSCCSGGSTFNGPDGGPFAGGFTSISAFGGTSGLTAPNTMFLVGVFRDADGPGVAPAALNYSGASPTPGDAAFAPAIDQVFFIGDGLTGTGSGSTQLFAIPDSATLLQLGFADAFAFTGAPGWYGDNMGTLKADFTVTGVPEPSTWALMALGLVGVAAAGRRRHHR